MPAVYTVITTINQPTAAVRAHAALAERRLLVVGDRKTPSDWRYAGVEFIPYQEHGAYKLGEKLPFDHYCRKMIGYLRAMETGAEIIIDTDDDNPPYTGQAFPPFEGEFNATAEDLGFFNAYGYYSKQRIWPRGFPLRFLAEQKNSEATTERRKAAVRIWQGLADRDPDVDAIFRLLFPGEYVFEKKGPLVLAPGTCCPFNSQNTAFHKDAFPLLYLPAQVSFRFTDILRSYVAQPILWAAGFALGFTEASVYQERNAHDLLRDFEDEIPVYLLSEKALEAVAGAVSAGRAIADNLARAYQALYEMKIVPKSELELLDIWLACF